MNLVMNLFLHPFIAGLLYASGFPVLGTTYYFFLGPILGFTLLGISLERSSILKKQIFQWLCFSLGFYALGFNWIPYTLYEFGSVPSPLNQIIGVFSSVILLPPVLFFIVIMSLVKRHLPRIHIQIKKSPAILSLISTFLFEVVPSQFPAFPGHTWMALSPYLGLANIFGEQIYTFISIFCSIHLIQMLKIKVLL